MKILKLKVGALTLTYNEEQAQEIMQAIVELLTDDHQNTLVLTLAHPEQLMEAFRTCGKHLPVC